MPLNHKRSNEPYPLFIIPLDAIFLQSPLSPPPFWQVSLLPLLPSPSILQVLYSKWSHVQAIFFHGEIIIALWSIRAFEWYVAGFVYLEKLAFLLPLFRSEILWVVHQFFVLLSTRSNDAAIWKQLGNLAIYASERRKLQRLAWRENNILSNNCSSDYRKN